MGYADLIARERMPDRMVDVELAHSQSQKGMGLGFYRAGAGNDAGRGKWDIVGEHMQILSVALAPGEQLESEPGGMMYMSDGVKAEADFSCPGACVRCLGGEKCVLMHYKNAGGKPGFVGITPARPADIVALDCVEINQCVGCTRQFFTKSFLGDDAAVLARSSGEEPRLRADKELICENAVVVLLRYVCASDVYVRALLEDSFWSG